jgi:hypothetical protein
MVDLGVRCGFCFGLWGLGLGFDVGGLCLWHRVAVGATRLFIFPQLGLQRIHSRAFYSGGLRGFMPHFTFKWYALV